MLHASYLFAIIERKETLIKGSLLVTLYGDSHKENWKEAAIARQIFFNELNQKERPDLVLSEDMHAYDGENPYIKERALCITGIPSGLVALCKKNGINAESLEHRFVRHVAEYNAQNYPTEKPMCLMPDIVHEYESVIEQINQYDDGPSLAAYYRSQCTIVASNNQKSFELMKSCNDGLSTFLEAHVIKSDRDTFFSQLSFFDVRLFDVCAAHRIIAYEKKHRGQDKKIVVLVGRGHAYNIADILKKYAGFSAFDGQLARVDYPDVSLDLLVA